MHGNSWEINHVKEIPFRRATLYLTRRGSMLTDFAKLNSRGCISYGFISQEMDPFRAQMYNVSAISKQLKGKIHGIV